MAGEMQQLAKTRIGQAIISGNAEELKNLILQGEDPHFKDRKGNTFLHYVCTMYRPSVFHILAATGIDINSVNKFGYTPLHVTALQNEGCHISDVLCWGADPLIQAKDGKVASEMTRRSYWHSTYDKYKPGIFQAVKEHDIEKVKHLLHCWCKMDSERNGQTLRQYAAALKFHDIVYILDQHKYTLDAIYGVLEKNYEKVEAALKKSRCNINFVNLASQKKHILQHALYIQDRKLVYMLCDAGADVNLPIYVRCYFRGPLYFEAVNPSVPPDIMWKILKSDANFKLKDERGRNAMIFAMDRGNGHMPLEVFKYMIQNGGNIADRDETGVTMRDVARFNRRLDILTFINEHYIAIIKASDMQSLRNLAMDGYDSMLIKHNYRDSYIYAAGNETEEAYKFMEWLPTYQRSVVRLFKAIRTESLRLIQDIVDRSEDQYMIINSRDKLASAKKRGHLCSHTGISIARWSMLEQALRTPLMLATLYAREDVIKYLLGRVDINVNAQDCCGRTCYHYTFMLGWDGQSIRKQLLATDIDTSIKDVCDRVGDMYVKIPNKEQWVAKEIHAKYGMDLELLCVDKYEELRKLIRGKRKGVKDFVESVKHFPFPVVAFPKILQPLMPDFRDLIFLSVDYGKDDIAIHLANLGADLFRKEVYVKKTKGDEVEEVRMTIVERAMDLSLDELGATLSKKQERILQGRPMALIPKRSHARFKEALAMKPQLYKSIFVTQNVPSRI